MGKTMLVIDGSEALEIYLSGCKKGMELSAEIMAPESEIETELNKNGITTEDGEE